MDITGVGSVPSSTREYTSEENLDAYNRDMDLIAAFFKVNPPTVKSIQGLRDAIDNLKNLLLNGDGKNPPTYLKDDMVENIAVLFQILRDLGISISDNPEISVAQAKEIKNKWNSIADSYVSGTSATMQQVLDEILKDRDITATYSLAQMVYLEFLIKGNESISAELMELKEALTISKEAIDLLAALQGFANKVTIPEQTPFHPPGKLENSGELNNELIKKLKEVDGLSKLDLYWKVDQMTAEDIVKRSKGTITFEEALKQTHGTSDFINKTIGDPVKGDKKAAQAYESAYNVLSDAHFKPINPVANVEPGCGEDLLRMRDQLQSLVDKLQAPPYNMDMTDQTTLAYSLNEVVKTINQSFGENPDDLDAAAKSWILSNYTHDGTKGGTLFNVLNQAVNASVSMNDKAKDDVQGAQYKLDQFFRAADSVMKSLFKASDSFVKKIN